MSSLTILLIIWGAITAVLIVLGIWRALVGMREENQIFLDPAEEKMAQEMQQIISKAERIERWMKGFGIASAALLVVIAGVWIYRGLTTFTNPPMP